MKYRNFEMEINTKIGVVKESPTGFFSFTVLSPLALGRRSNLVKVGRDGEIEYREF